jgi:ketosteroid isomerase-like protein
MLLGAMDPKSVVTNLWRSWAQQDKQAVLSLCADDVVLSLYVPEHVLPFGGETRGRRALSDRLQTIIEQFETLHYEGAVHHVMDGTLHGVVHYCFRHRATGEDIDGDMRHVVQVRDGLIVDCKEYHDLKRVTAFMRLVSDIAHKP